MNSPVWWNPALVLSPDPSVDGSPEEQQGSLIDADPEIAQEKRLSSSPSLLPYFGYESVALESKHALRARHRVRRLSYSLRSLPRRGLLVFTVASAALFLTFGLGITSHLHRRLSGYATSDLGRSPQPFRAQPGQHAEDGVWPATLGAGGTTELCDICDCTIQPGLYAPKPEAFRYEPRPQIQDVFPTVETVSRDAYMRQSLLDIYCAGQYMTRPQTTRLVRRTAEHLDQMISWNISGLVLGKPTVYLTTNTSPNGKAGPLRPQYMRRHARTLLDWQAAQARPGNGSDWQVLWVIVEDELDADADVIRTLRRIGVPYVYYAYGPTNGWGHGQRNAALQLIHTLTQDRRRGGLFGHGPVYCLDDDNKMLPELLTRMTTLERIGVFPVGNFGVVGGYEKPLISPIGRVMGSNSPWRRRYPFDNAGFAFNSSLLGTAISGPAYWKWTVYGGESEFIEQTVSDIGQLEPLCGHDPRQDCRLAWHNEPLAELEKLTDDAETQFIERFGWEMWRARLNDELRTRAQKRGY